MEFGTQVIAEQVCANSINGFVQQHRLHFQRKPGVTTTSQMVSLRTGFAALAFGTACQLLQFSVKFFDLPAQVIRFLSNLSDHSLIQIIQSMSPFVAFTKEGDEANISRDS